MSLVKNILLISTIVNTPRAYKGTSVCNYFAKEWCKLGHKVIVIYLHTNYPPVLYWIANLSINTIQSKTGAIIYSKPDFKHYKFCDAGVEIYQLPIFKYFPHGQYTRQSINNAVKSILDVLTSNNFVPDIISGHFPNPQIEIVSRLKIRYPESSTAIIMHGYNNQIHQIYKNNFQKLSDNIDVWGFRSEAIKTDFIKRYGSPHKNFICYSGIPEYFFDRVPDRFTNNHIRNFLYCGTLIKRKYPDKVLEALDLAFPSNNFTLTYIGIGGELSKLKKLAKERNNIKFLGRIPRKDIIKELDKADCLIMISKSEAFGLVYLEAMARGCITIASRNEGMDGIIQNGVNGFLCEAGNALELSKILKGLNNLNTSSISQKAVETSSQFTDKKVAINYIENILYNR